MKKQIKYKDRFQKFYHLNKKRLNKERKLIYQEKKAKGICTRCKKKAIKGIQMCKYHQIKQMQYNRNRR